MKKNKYLSTLLPDTLVEMATQQHPGCADVRFDPKIFTRVLSQENAQVKKKRNRLGLFIATTSIVATLLLVCFWLIFKINWIERYLVVLTALAIFSAMGFSVIFPKNSRVYLSKDKLKERITHEISITTISRRDILLALINKIEVYTQAKRYKQLPEILLGIENVMKDSDAELVERSLQKYSYLTQVSSFLGKLRVSVEARERRSAAVISLN